MANNQFTIAIDCRELCRYSTGIGRFLLTFLDSVAKSGSEYRFVLIGNQFTLMPEFIYADKRIFKPVTANEFLTLYFDQITIPQILDSTGSDLFFSPYYKKPFFSRVPAISTLFDITYIAASPYKNNLSNIYYRFFISLTGKRSRAIITCSEYSKKDIINYFRFPENSVIVTPLCVDPRFSRKEELEIAKIKDKYGLKKKYILCVGNFMPHKNLGRLTQAFLEMPRSIRQNYNLVLAGADPSASARKSDEMILLKNVNDSDLPLIYCGADLFAYPSLYEGFGLPPLEAMACGCPVVSSNTSSMPEVLGDACIYFDPCRPEDIAQKMIMVLEDPALRKSLSEKGLSRAKMFTPEIMTRSLLDVFGTYNER